MVVSYCLLSIPIIQILLFLEQFAFEGDAGEVKELADTVCPDIKHRGPGDKNMCYSDIPKKKDCFYYVNEALLT